MLRRTLILLPLLAVACRANRVAPPSANFLMLAGDSTFWVRSGAQGVRARGSPILLGRYQGRFYEIYVIDEDHSYYDAVIIGQRAYRRDLLTGDSLLIFDDTTIANVARTYAEQHPNDRPLEPDEEPSDEPHTSATSELTPLDQYGPFLSLDYKADVSVEGGNEWHQARRSVVDLRSGKQATMADLFGKRNAVYLLRKGKALFSQQLDSVLASRDVRAREAAGAIAGFEFDSTSFSVTEIDRSPAVQFVAPGHGTRAGGLTLTLPPIKVTAPSWWDEVIPTLPSTRGDSSGDRWSHHSYQVIARYDRDGDAVHLALADTARREWPVAQLPAPARRIFWLDEPGVDSTTLRALARAFDEAALYSEEVRTAMTEPDPLPPTSSTPRPGRPVRDSQHETSEIMMPQHANVLGHVFGGVILSMMDRAAAVAAIRHARGNCVTVSVDRVDFREPIHVGDLVVMKASVNFAGRTSMEVGVRVEAENLIDGVRRHTNSCYVTFVAIDRNGRPVEVPPLIAETDVEKRRYAAAMERRRRRLEERKAEEG
jgi:acyl-CoA hydrolase